MKVVILAGGLGTRISEETESRPKPMIDIGAKPILWHIMKMYSSFGVNEFIICCGYKGYVIKEYFSNYFLHHSDIKIDLQNNSLTFLKDNVEPWKITMVDTGEETMTGGRLLRIKDYLDDGETFCCTYGDGLGDINIDGLIDFHKSHGKKATLTAVHAPGRFGALKIANDKVDSFQEKPKGDGSMINGGFFVLNKDVLNYIEGDASIWEREAMETLAKEGQLMAFKHHGFWQPLDTLRDKVLLEKMWVSKKAPWKSWD
jgi:glucose-1-phosphate cytidylyltransferase